MYDIIIKEEKSDERKQKILSEVEKLFIGLTASLDSRSREQFNTRFTALKTFIFDLNATSWQCQQERLLNTLSLDWWSM